MEGGSFNGSRPKVDHELSPIILPERYNYIGVFLTLGCNYNCSYCINNFNGKVSKYPMISGREWIKALNRLRSRDDLPITLQGGEPSLHPDFMEIICGIRSDLKIDILTNLRFDVDKFMEIIPPERIKRDAPYASIRVSYHPEFMELNQIKNKVLKLLKNGYSVGIWAVKHPLFEKIVKRAYEECRAEGIDFRLKEFLGFYNGKLYGTYKYPDSLWQKKGPDVECRTSELLIGPSGDVFRCHSDLYMGREPIGNLCDENFQIEDIYRFCDAYGFCCPCDVKIKTNRFQQFGHTSVDIRLI